MTVVSRVSRSKGLRLLRPRVSFVLNGVRADVDEEDAGRVAFEDCSPMRRFPQWERKRHYSGHYWSQTVRRHLPFESLFERAAMMLLDREPGVVGLSAQPMTIVWPEQCEVDSHTPDIFVRYSNGDGEVVDARPRARRDEAFEATVAATGRVCAVAGLRYSVVDDIPADMSANLDFLCCFRHAAFAANAEWASQLHPHLPMSLFDAAYRLGGEPDGFGQVFSLLWHGALATDLRAPLNVRSVVEIGRENRECHGG